MSNIVEFYVDKLHRLIDKEINNNNIQNAVTLLSSCTNLEFCSNHTFIDEFVEEKIINLSNEYTINKLENKDNKTIFFYDGFGIDNRGLASIYLKSLAKSNRIIYVTFDNRKSCICNLENIVKTSDGEVLFISEKNKLSEIEKLIKIVEKYKPFCSFKYNEPNDIVANVFFTSLKDVLTRYQINLTDDAYWSGLNAFDYVIDFRDFGSVINKNYRKISEEKIVLLPMYPRINEIDFKGLPFELNNKKLIFSGGQLYKTLSEDNNYYKIVEYILSEYQDTIFYYLGKGDTTKISKLVHKYPDRCFIENEREDFFEVIKKSYFTLSTYPICGGLMIQYSAAAGKIPLTLIGDSTDGLLRNRVMDNCQFENIEEVKLAVNKLMSDINSLGINIEELKESVIDENGFDKALSSIIHKNKSKFEIDYHVIDNDMVSKQSYDLMKDEMRVYDSIINDDYQRMFRYFPKETIYLIFDKIFKKVKRDLWK